MSAQQVPLSPPPDYIRAEKGLWSWLSTTDHKRIGIMYLAGILFFFLFAMCLGLLIRFELLKPGTQFMDGALYNRVLTLHGIAMVFLFVIPSIMAVFGNFILPLHLGANDVAFPRLNLASWWLYMIGGLFAVISIGLGGPDTGWTFYVPYSATTNANVLFPMTAAFILGWSSILTSINFIVTVHRMRAKNQGWFDLPLFVWGLYATSWIGIFSTPVVGITLILVLVERFTLIGFFDPNIGGDPILFQHLFWIYSHPAVYIMVLPAMGVASEIFPVFSRKRIFGYKFIAISSMAIAGLGSLVWAHHMFTSGMADEGRVIFSFLTFLVSIPSAVKVFNWLATMYKGSIRLYVPLGWSLGFVFLFLIGGLTGMVQGALATDIHIHDTAFIVAHFHYTMFGGAGTMFFAALHYWYPKMFGRMYGMKKAWAGFLIWFVGFNVLYFPLFIAGLKGMPRRYADYLPKYESYHQLSTIGSWILATGLLIVVYNLVVSLWKGKKATPNPWGGATLEWTIPSPPPKHPFPATVEVERDPYDYKGIEPEVEAS